MAQTPEQLEEEESTGLLRFTVAGTERVVPELKRTANRAWKARMREVFASLVETPADTPEGLDAMADAELELIRAYDATGALGDLEDATEREVDAIYQRLVTVAHPLASSPTAAMTLVFRAVVASALESSTSSGSPSGTSPRTPSTQRSRTGRSSASTARRRRGSTASGATA